MGDEGEEGEKRVWLALAGMACLMVAWIAGKRKMKSFCLILIFIFAISKPVSAFAETVDVQPEGRLVVTGDVYLEESHLPEVLPEVYVYGDVEYVSHVLRYYVANPETAVTNESAKSILKELKEHNKADADVWAVIEKGASLIGSVQYSMEKRQGDGRDNPEFLDCSSFTAWSFHKAGNNGIAYGSTTETFRTSSKFVDIEAKNLRPGDIGLKSPTAGTGGANHVGIYCGTLKNGTKVWLHCTSSSGSSLTGNDSGAMFGAYTGFTYFRRLKKWNK